MAEINTKSGVWLDTSSRKVVTSEPVEGVLLAAPGDEVTDELEATVERFGRPVFDEVAPVDAVTAPARRTTRKA